MEVIAWGANPRPLAKKGSRKNMAKKKRRSAAQRAATKRMLAANKSHKSHGGGKKRRKGGKRKAGRRKGKKHTHWASIGGYTRKSKVGGHRRRTNPFSMGSGAKGFMGLVLQGAAVGAGALATNVVAQNVLPQSLRNGDMQSAAAKGVLGLGLGFLASKVGPLKRFASAISVGAVASAFRDIVDPPVLAATAKNLLNEAYYLGELDVRKLVALGTTPAAAKPRLLGELDKRTRAGAGTPAANANRAAIRGSATAMEPQ